MHDAFIRTVPFRPKVKHIIHYAVLDGDEGGFSRYRVIDPVLAGEHQEAIIHTQTVHAHPDAWAKQLLWRPKGVVFTNDTGVGYVRRASLEQRANQDFRKELARQTK